jgi:hypothetical protein
VTERAVVEECRPEERRDPNGTNLATPPLARGRQLWWTAVVAAGALLPIAAALGSGHTLVWRDTARLFTPVRGLIVASLRALRLPLWNPYEALGIPLLAQAMDGALHPVSLLGALLAPGAGMDLFIAIHVALAALGAFALARELGASPAGAAAGGLAYGLSGYLLGMSAVITYLAGAATAPWAIAGLRRAGRRTPFGVAAAAVAVAILLVAGEPQWAMVAIALGLVLAIEGGGARGLVSAAVALAVGAALAGVQLVPAWAFFRETARAGGLTLEERMQWSLAPWRVLELIAPGFFAGRPGTMDAPVFLQLGGPTAYSIPFAPSVFVGAVTIALAAAGARASRAARLLAGAAVVLLWMSLGPHLGADQTLRAVPVWGSFRYAEKLVGPLTLCVAMLAALGTDRIATAPRRKAAASAIAAATAAALVAMLALWPGVERVFGGGAAAAASLARERLAVGSAHAAIGLGLLAGALALAVRLGVQQRFAAVAAALVFVQSAAAAPFALHWGVRGVRDDEPLRDLRDSNLVTRLAVPVEAASAYAPAHLDEWDRLVAVASRLGETPYAIASHIDEIEPYTGLLPHRFARVAEAFGRAFGPWKWAAWRRFALTHVSMGPPMDARAWADARAAVQGGQRIQQHPEWGFTVWEVPHRPWAFFAQRAVSATSEDGACQRLVEIAAGDGAEVVVEGPAPAQLAPGRILSAERGAERLRIEAEAAGDGLFVVQDAFWPGWKAAIDGRSVPILPTDVLVRAVAWPAGRHVLEMKYQPPEVRLGLATSMAGTATLLAVAAVPWLRRRAKGHSRPARG